MKFLQSSNQPIDVSSWRRHEEFAEYPEGARDKTLLYCPAPAPYNFLREGHRYLFKLSSPKYIEQFWVEIVAYIIGNKMDIPVPPAFAAYDSEKNQSGALIEWFLQPVTLLGDEIHIPGGDYCQQFITNFDRKKGKQHNFETIALIFNELNIPWKIYWAKIFLFDALIGNTDRHQDNWGIIETPTQSNVIQKKLRFAPVFDNGTSMGHEMPHVSFKKFENNISLEKYIQRGRHHIKWSLNDSKGIQHIDLVKRLSEIYPETRKIMIESLKKITLEDFKDIINNLVAFNVPVRLTAERAGFMLKLLQSRYQHLLHELEN